MDAGSIEQHGIELAVVPAAATSVVMGSSCYDSPRNRCRIPDDCIDENRYPLFMARTVMTELMASLQASGRAQT